MTPQQVLSPTSPTFIAPPARAPLYRTPTRQRSPFSRCPKSRVATPRRCLLSVGLHTHVSPPPAPAFPSRIPFLLASGPSPARRIPQLHRLHGAAGSRLDPLTAPSSPGTSQSPPRRPSHTSAFRPNRKRSMRAELGEAAGRGPGHVVRRGADPELWWQADSYRESPAEIQTSSGVVSLGHCSRKTVGPRPGTRLCLGPRPSFPRRR